METECKKFWVGENGTIFWGEEDPRKPIVIELKERNVC